MNMTPKLLPWLARKAGISNETATALWREVASDESLQAGFSTDPDHAFRLIVERLQDLAARDRAALKQTTPGHSPVLVLTRHGDHSSAILLNPFGLKAA